MIYQYECVVSNMIGKCSYPNTLEYCTFRQKNIGVYMIDLSYNLLVLFDVLDTSFVDFCVEK